MSTLKAAFSASQMRNYRLAFGLTGAAAVGGSAWLFRDLADLSQWYVSYDDIIMIRYVIYFTHFF